MGRAAVNVIAVFMSVVVVFNECLWLGRWHAQIQFDGRKKHLGTFRTQIEAALRYDEVARKLYGNAAKLNFQTRLIPKNLMSSDSTPAEDDNDSDLASLLLSLKSGNSLSVKEEPKSGSDTPSYPSTSPHSRKTTRPKCCVMRDIMQSKSQLAQLPLVSPTCPSTYIPNVPVSNSTLPSTVYPFLCAFPVCPDVSAFP